MTRDALDRLVSFALPRASSVARENFAGDALVEGFCKRLAQQTGLDLEYFVAWGCPPLVLLVRSGQRNAIVRSERLDTLLVEAAHVLQSCAAEPLQEVADEIAQYAVLQWMAEFFIGYRQSGLALAALHRQGQSGARVAVTPFRDESLASVDPRLRAAIQCLSVAHEVGHAARPRRAEVDLGVCVDGLSLWRHLERECLAVPSREAQSALLGILRQHVNAADLLCEVEADLFALDCVVHYLDAVLECNARDSISAALVSFQTLATVYSCMESCRVLVEHLLASSDIDHFFRDDFLAAAKLSVRARAMMRRASMLWFALENPGQQVTADGVNPYVSQVDALFSPRQSAQQKIVQATVDAAHDLFAHHRALDPSRMTYELSERLRQVERDAALHSQLHSMLVGFGCPGGVDVVRYLMHGGGAARVD